MPRSGSTWLSQIFAASPDVLLKSCPLFSYEFKNQLNAHSTAEEWRKLFSDLYHTNSEFLDQNHLRDKGLIPKFAKTNKHPPHLVVKSNRFHGLTPRMLELLDSVCFIHLVRNPCATLHSWLSNPHEFPSWADPRSEWRTGACRKNGVGEYWGFDDWIKTTRQGLSLSNLYPERYQIVQYEQLVQSPSEHLTELCSRLGLPYSDEMKSFIKTSHSRHDTHKHSVFKSPANIAAWKDQIDPVIWAACEKELIGTDLARFLI